MSSTALRATGEAIKRKLSAADSDDGPSEAAKRLVKGLDELKGAAMKVGQMMSLENDMLPPGWQDALSVLQSSSTPRPFSEMKKILQNSLGSLDAFAHIEPEAHHAASMSQVHRAVLKDSGTEVALKIRYPDLKEHIASDLKSIQMMMKMAGVVRREEEVKRILSKVREVFELELDFTHERKKLQDYAELLRTESEFEVAEPLESLCREDVLVTKWLHGKGMDQWFKESQRGDEACNRLGCQLVRIILLEIFHFKQIQSDPNPANFLVLDNGKLGLVDFGAVVNLPDSLIEPYRKLACAALDGTKEEVISYAKEVGYITEKDSREAQDSFVKLMAFVSEPFYHGTFCWKNTDLSKRIKDESLRYARHTFLRPPPEDLIFLNRRILGTEMFLERLGPVVPARSYFEEIVRPGPGSV